MIATFNSYQIVPLQANSGANLHELVQNNIPQIRTYFPGMISDTDTLEKSKNFCTTTVKKAASMEYLAYLIQDTRTKKSIGLVDVKRLDMRVPKAELGYFIIKPYEGQGITTRAVNLVSEYLAEKYGFIKLLLRISPENSVSARVAVKAGYKLEGVIRNDFRIYTGEVIDVEYYGRIF